MRLLVFGFCLEYYIGWCLAVFRVVYLRICRNTTFSENSKVLCFGRYVWHWEKVLELSL